jgi:hypothetical protein
MKALQTQLPLEAIITFLRFTEYKTFLMRRNNDTYFKKKYSHINKNFKYLVSSKIDNLEVQSNFKKYKNIRVFERIGWDWDCFIKKIIERPIFSNLQKLIIMEHYIDKIKIPDKLVNLRELVISSNSISSLIIPPTLKKLQKIDCHNNKLKRLKIPKTLTQLKYLNCSINKLTELKIPTTVVNLNTILCSKNSFFTLKLPHLPRLKKLICSDCPIVDFTQIFENAINLEIFDGTKCNAKKIVIPDGMTALKHLYCGNFLLSKIVLTNFMTNLETINCCSSISKELLIPPDCINLRSIKFYSNYGYKNNCILNIPHSVDKIFNIDISSGIKLNIGETSQLNGIIIDGKYNSIYNEIDENNFV